MELVWRDGIPYFEYFMELDAPPSRQTAMLPGNRRPTNFGVKVEVKPRDEFGAGVRVSEVKMKCVSADTLETAADGAEITSRVQIDPNVSHYTGEYKSRKLIHKLQFRSEPLEQTTLNETAYNRKIIIKEG
jgi:hypothetical protein